MSALTTGVSAPEIQLPFTDGTQFSLHQSLRQGPAVLVFFKVSCPVCQFALPYLERIYKAHGQNPKLTFVAVSQDNLADTQAFNRQFGITIPTLLDEPKKYPASNAYGLTNVPTVFMISPAGEVEFSSVSWAKQEVEDLNRKLAELGQSTPAAVFRAGENVPEFKAG